MAKSDSLSHNERLQLLHSAQKTAIGNQLDSLYLKVILEKSNLFFDRGNVDSAIYNDNRLILESRRLHSKYFLGKGYFNRAYNFKSNQQFDSAFYYHNLAKSAFEEIEEFSQVGRRLLSMAIIQKNQSDYFGAKETLVEAIDNLKKAEDDKFLASSYNELGTNHKKLFNFSSAIENYNKAIEFSKNQKDILSYKNNLAVAYHEQGNYPMAIRILEKILDSDELNKNSLKYARIYDNLLFSKWKSGEDINELDFQVPIEIRKSRADLRGLTSSYFHLGLFHSKKNIQKSIIYFDSLIQLAKTLEMPESEVMALQNLMVLEPKNSDHMSRYIALKDSLYEKELTVKTQFAKMKYDDKQQKARLISLESESVKKEAQLARQESRKVLFLSLIAILLVSGASLFLILRQRHKKEKLQEIYSTEKRISQDLHDGLGNSVFGLMAKLQGNSIKNEELLNGLEKIYQTTRDVAHQNSHIDTNHFENELKTLIQSYQNNGTTIVVKGFRKLTGLNMKIRSV